MLLLFYLKAIIHDGWRYHDLIIGLFHAEGLNSHLRIAIRTILHFKRITNRRLCELGLSQLSHLFFNFLLYFLLYVFVLIVAVPGLTVLQMDLLTNWFYGRYLITHMDAGRSWNRFDLFLFGFCLRTFTGYLIVYFLRSPNCLTFLLSAWPVNLFLSSSHELV